MAIPTKSFDDVLKRTLANVRTSFPGFPLGTKKFLGRVARAWALVVWGLQKGFEQLDRDVVPNAKSSTDLLTSWLVTAGLPDGAGGFGRLLPVAASGGAAMLTGVKGTAFPDGTVALAEDGVTQVAVSGTVTIPGSPSGFGSIVAKIVAITTGSSGNLPVGTICTWQSPPAGADASFTLTSPLTGGIDSEDNPSAFARFAQRLQTPPRGGVAEDYRLWATVTGVEQVYVYPKRSGTGTVDVVVVGGGQGQNRAPSVSVVAAAQASIDVHRPVCADGAIAYAPYMPNANGHAVRVRVVPSLVKYDFDWDDTSGPFSVFTYATEQITLNTIAPASLKGAIDAYNAGASLAPRLQVISTLTNPIGTAVNPQIRAIAWSDGGGKTTLTLEPLPTGWVIPTSGDIVYAGGPVVDSIAAGLQDLADSLGPSRVSGMQDQFSTWPDTLAISEVSRVASEALDTDGTRLVAEVLVGTATVDGSALDVQAGDSSSNPPELLYLKSVAVTQ